MTDCLFCGIASGGIPAEIVVETEDTLAFRDRTPQAPTHVLVIPRDHHRDAAALVTADPALMGAMLATAAEVANVDGIAETGYRMVFNTGADGHQTVFHVHLHVLGGRSMGWPPG